MFAFKNNLRGDGGYIAIMSAIIISIVVAVIVFVISMGAFLARANISAGYYKEISSSLAKACVQVALSKLAANGSYAGNETIGVASSTCRIISVTAPGGQQNVISAQGMFESSFTDLRVTVNSNSLSVTNWEELPNF